ncbi:hypothetical protein [Ferrovibrio sp.]|uniref:hypothetical protein n=1 Tax=Ferrovibrio sp. TaxID=1917215 RepID=UPI00311E4D43
MAKPTVTSSGSRRPRASHLLVAAAAAVAVLAHTEPALPAMQVIDEAAITKMIDQINQLKKQLDEMVKMNKALQDQINAMGRVGQIAVPSINLGRITSRLRQDAQCLAPDLSKLMPDVDFENADWASICQAGDAYRQSLWLDPNQVRTMSWDKQSQKRREIQTRRFNMGVDVASKAIGQGDIAVKGAEDTNKAVSELEAAMDAATDQNSRLAVIAKGMAINARATAQQTQVLAQLLKVQSTWFALTALPPDSKLAGEGSEGAQ